MTEQNPVPEQQVPDQAGLPGKKAWYAGWKVLSAVAIIVILGAAVGYAVYKKQQTRLAGQQTSTGGYSKDSSNNPVVVTTNPYEFPAPVEYNPASSTPVDSNDPYYESLAASPTFFDCTSTTVSGKKVSGEIEWQRPEPVASTTLFTSGNPFYGQPVYYKLGHFAAGGYVGADLYLVDVPCDGMCLSDTFYYLVKKGDKISLLEKESPGSSAFYPSAPSVPGVGIDRNYSIQDLVYPNSVKGPQGQSMNLASMRAPKAFCAYGKIKAFTDPELGDVYTDPVDKAIEGRSSNYGFYVESPDGMEVDYTIDIPFMGGDNIPKIVWNSGKKNMDDYVYTDRTGCGSFNYVSVITPDVVNPEADLQVSGSGIGGEQILEFKNPGNPYLKDFYETYYYPMDGGEKMPYADFVKIHPLFFWKDPFGRLIKFQKNSLLPVAECGKPVIYLYPHQTQKVSVKLNPVGGFSYTEPAYGSGWNVIADPQSNITNLADGKTYPYLFWEGRGGLYQTPKQGFVVQQADVHQFLVTKLGELGLNAKESKDFMDFWEPKMQGSPYYFVAFLGNQAMDSLAPLSVDPKPDTVIRVLMDFTPLDHPIDVQGYTIRTPERKGFTVVEWGGVIR